MESDILGCESCGHCQAELWMNVVLAFTGIIITVVGSCDWGVVLVVEVYVLM